MADYDVPERDIDLVLVTGAGASREFGVNDSKVPLMADWSDSLVEKIGQRSWAYLEATKLEKGLGGSEFERRLGEFLQVAQALPKIKEVLDPSLEFQAITGSLVRDTLREWHRITVSHVGQIIELIRQSLYESFSHERMDLDAAARAYSMLLQQLGVSNVQSLVYATTNYDWVGEYAIERLGGRPDWGERRLMLRQGEAQLEVEGILGGMPRYVPVLHLHGRMGWYRRDDLIFGNNTTAHSEGYGVPIVMLPDPDKVYSTDPVIFSLWNQFEEALRRAKRVFVLGHSLNDRPLVEALQRNVIPIERVAVTVLAGDNTPQKLHASATDTAEVLARDLPAVSMVPIRFSQNQVTVRSAVEAWNDRLTKALGHPGA
jgi:hypothetical protein